MPQVERAKAQEKKSNSPEPSGKNEPAQPGKGEKAAIPAEMSELVLPNTPLQQARERYQTAEEALLRDIEKHLANDPMPTPDPKRNRQQYFAAMVRTFKERMLRPTRQQSAAGDFAAEQKAHEQMTRALDAVRVLLNRDDKGLVANTGQKTPILSGKGVAEALMYHLFDPGTIDQGYNPTCAMAVTEITLAYEHPDKYAELVKDLATKGKVTLGDGKVFTPPRSTLLPDSEARSFKLSTAQKTQDRSYPSMLAQRTLVNLDRQLFGGVAWYYSGDPSPQNDTNHIPRLITPLTGTPVRILDTQVLRSQQDNVLKQNKVVTTIGGNHIQAIIPVFDREGNYLGKRLDNSHGEGRDSYRQSRNR